MNGTGRILLVGIKNLGSHPCPRCLIPLSDTPKFGMVRDTRRRQTLARKDTMNHRKHISNARKYIHDENYAVDSAPVKRLLDAESLVPSAVRLVTLLTLKY
jgi:uncharacterized protein YcbX